MGSAAGNFRNQLLFRERLVGFGLHLGLLVFRLHCGGLRFLGQQLVLELHSKVFERCFGRMQCQARIERFLLDLRVGQFQDDGVRLDLRPGSQKDSVHAAIGSRGQPPRVLRDERAEAAMLADDRAALDGVREDGRALDGRRGGLHPGQCNRHPDDDEDADSGVERMPQLLAFENRGVADDIRHRQGR